MIKKLLLGAGLALALCFSAASCGKLMTSGQTGAITVSFNGSFLPTTRSAVPDTNDFILNVTDAAGKSLYSGLYGAAPESIIADPGTYTVSAYSREFTEPLYDAPQYGDTRTVVVLPGKTSGVTLECTLLNCGIRIYPDWNFLAEYPDGYLYLKNADGTLMYGYSENRTAYFKPGTVAVSMVNSGTERLLCTRVLEAREVLHLNLSAVVSGSSSEGIRISVDTLSTRIEDVCTVPLAGQGNDVDSAYDVSEARYHVGEDDVWVYGFIVGGDLTSSKCSFEAPFTSRTNLVIASRSSCTDKSSCLSVQLPSGDVRDELNLVDHSDNLGRQVLLKGQIVESYYGITGVQNISEWQWK